ncbi:MAG: Na/Pi cotransporter family protein [Patescibacteria group bacterium]|nr:Na/Pi cotransporter family protein [Patescibacteria group bacterium]
MAQEIILFLTGLMFVLFGMIRLSYRMQMVFNSRIRQYIKYLSQKPIYGVGLGAISTAVFQCSATIIFITIGLVSAGVISVENSLGIILGANIGTVLTAQLVAFKIMNIAPIFLIIGMILWLAASAEKLKNIGKVIFYFGLIFFGLNLINSVIIPLKGNQDFLNFFQGIKNPILGILIGFAATVLVQSSSIITSILVLLGQQSLITLEIGLPLILGANIGATIIPFLFSLGGGVSARRAGISNVFFKVITVVILFPFLSYYVNFIKHLTDNTAQQIVNSHFFFSILVACLFIFLIKPFAKLLEKIIPGQEKILPLWSEFLDEQCLKEPSQALEAVQKELKRGAQLTQEMFKKAFEIISTFSNRGYRSLNYLELVIDNLQKEVMGFIDKIPKNKLTSKNAAQLIQCSSMVDDIERIGDHIINLVELAKYRVQCKVKFSKAAKQEIEDIKIVLDKIIKDLIILIEVPNQELSEKILRHNEKIREMIIIAKEKHLERFYQRECNAADGPIFNDILVNLGGVATHCANMAKYYQEKNINF